jgi:alkaline phosphatase
MGTKSRLLTPPLAAAVLWGAATATAHANPASVAVLPTEGARFLAGQRFDLRIEGKGVGPYSAKLAIDGEPVELTSGEQNTETTDGISADGYGGFNIRGYTNKAPGVHTIEGWFTDSTGTASVTSSFEILDAGAYNGEHAIKNIILMLGDGMGTSHRTAARLVRHGSTLGDPNDYLAMDKLGSTGMITTASLNSIITDSAPGMAGYSTGSHAKNGQEGVYPANIKNPFYYPRVEYISEFLHRTRGTSTGIVTTADVEDATPAANAVHTGNRNNGTGIIDQFFDESDYEGSKEHGTGLRVLMGGGRRWFLPSGTFGSSRADATDYDALPQDIIDGWHLPADSGALDASRDVIADFQDNGFTYADSYSALKSATQDATPSKLLGLFGYGNMNVALDKLAKRRNVLLPGASTFVVDEYHAPDQPMLDEMASAALKVLSTDNKHGFFLLIEGAHIDKQSHAMDAERVIDEVIEFDRAVAVAREFADKVDNKTLIIVLADHETAGFSIIGGLKGTVADARALPSDGSTLDPATAPARQAHVGTYDDAGFPKYNILADGFPETLDIDGKILFGYGANGDRFETHLTHPRPIVDSLLTASIQEELDGAGYVRVPGARTPEGFFIRGQAVGLEQAVHTGADIPISAYSPKKPAALQFVGVQRNTDVFFKLIHAANGAY